MAEYLIFIHGVNTREIREQRTYADRLIELIKQRTPSEVLSLPRSQKVLETEAKK